MSHWRTLGDDGPHEEGPDSLALTSAVVSLSNKGWWSGIREPQQAASRTRKDLSGGGGGGQQASFSTWECQGVWRKASRNWKNGQKGWENGFMGQKKGLFPSPTQEVPPLWHRENSFGTEGIMTKNRAWGSRSRLTDRWLTEQPWWLVLLAAVRHWASLSDPVGP